MNSSTVRKRLPEVPAKEPSSAVPAHHAARTAVGNRKSKTTERRISRRAHATSRMLMIGHSTMPIDRFISLLAAHGVQCLVDVRTVPRSRHNPQFDQKALRVSLEEAGIAYVHFPELGGLRRAMRDSPNTGWRNSSFRGYADYMQTAEFAAGLDKLIELSKSKRIAFMCAEAVPWRCHRSLIADALMVRGIVSENIASLERTQVHTMTPFARVRKGQITYPAEPTETSP